MLHFVHKNMMLFLICLISSISILACDDEICNEEGGEERDDYYGSGEEGGEEGGEEFEECADGEDEGSTGGSTSLDSQYNYLVLVDSSLDFNQFGTPGADICDVVVDCGERLQFLEFESSQGDSPICSDRDPALCVCETEVAGICEGIDRVNPLNVENGLRCDGNDQNNQSPYYSLGMEGTLILDYDEDLSGCTVSTTERQGNDQESYILYACTESNFDPRTSDQCVEIGRSNNRGEIDTMIP